MPVIGGSAVKSAVPNAAAALVKFGDLKGNERKCVNRRGFGGDLGAIGVVSNAIEFACQVAGDGLSRLWTPATELPRRSLKRLINETPTTTTELPRVARSLVT